MRKRVPFSWKLGSKWSAQYMSTDWQLTPNHYFARLHSLGFGDKDKWISFSPKLSRSQLAAHCSLLLLCFIISKSDDFRLWNERKIMRSNASDWPVSAEHKERSQCRFGQIRKLSPISGIRQYPSLLFTDRLAYRVHSWFTKIFLTLFTKSTFSNSLT